MTGKTITIPINKAKALEKAKEIVAGGGMIAFPTDTIYGIGVSAYNRDAIEQLYRIKDRPKGKAIPILVGDADQLTGITTPPEESVRKIMDAFWPGALTLVLPMQPGLPDNLTRTATIGVRIPDHEITRTLLRRTGPLAATSANLSGKTSAQTAQQVEKVFGGRIDLILDGGPSPGGKSSTVLDCSGRKLVILRTGPISLEIIRAAIT